MDLNKLKQELSKEAYSLLTVEEKIALLEAQSVTEDTFRVTSGVARGFLARKGYWRKLKKIQVDLDHELFDLADTIIATATADGAYFGIDPSLDEGIANLASLQILVDKKIFDSADEFTNLSKKKSYPFKGVSEDDLIKAELLGEQASVKSNYMGNIGHHVRLRPDKNIRIFVKTKDPVPVDTNITITAYGCPDGQNFLDPSNYLENPNKINLVVKKGSQGVEFKMTSDSAKWLKFDAIANLLIGEFELHIQEA